MANQESGVPGGWGAKKGEGGGRVIEPYVPPTVTSGGTYTDAQGRPITQTQAQQQGRIDKPGEAGAKAAMVGASGGSQPAPIGLEALKQAEQSRQPGGLEALKQAEYKSVRERILSQPGQTYYLGTAQGDYRERPQQMYVSSYYLGSAATNYRERPQQIAPQLSFLSQVAPQQAPSPKPPQYGEIHRFGDESQFYTPQKPQKTSTAQSNYPGEDYFRRKAEERSGLAQYSAISQLNEQRRQKEYGLISGAPLVKRRIAYQGTATLPKYTIAGFGFGGTIPVKEGKTYIQPALIGKTTEAYDNLTTRKTTQTDINRLNILAAGAIIATPFGVFRSTASLKGANLQLSKVTIPSVKTALYNSGKRIREYANREKVTSTGVQKSTSKYSFNVETKTAPTGKANIINKPSNIVKEEIINKRQPQGSTPYSFNVESKPYSFGKATIVSKPTVKQDIINTRALKESPYGLGETKPYKAGKATILNKPSVAQMSIKDIIEANLRNQPRPKPISGSFAASDIRNVMGTTAAPRAKIPETGIVRGKGGEIERVRQRTVETVKQQPEMTRVRQRPELLTVRGLTLLSGRQKVIERGLVKTLERGRSREITPERSRVQTLERSITQERVRTSERSITQERVREREREIERERERERERQREREREREITRTRERIKIPEITKGLSLKSSGFLSKRSSKLTGTRKYMTKLGGKTLEQLAAELRGKTTRKASRGKKKATKKKTTKGRK